jgi:hypothetical protein
MQDLLAPLIFLAALIVACHAQPSEQYLRHKYGHRSVASATCADVREAVRTWGLATAEAVALQHGMTPRQRIRAYACLRS